jgi:hypothetical protein
MNKSIRSNILLILLIFFSSPLILQLSSCHPLKPFTDIETSDALKILQPGKRSADLIILDVRTPEEYAGGYIAGALTLILNHLILQPNWIHWIKPKPI